MQRPDMSAEQRCNQNYSPVYNFHKNICVIRRGQEHGAVTMMADSKNFSNKFHSGIRLSGSCDTQSNDRPAWKLKQKRENNNKINQGY